MPLPYTVIARPVLTLVVAIRIPVLASSVVIAKSGATWQSVPSPLTLRCHSEPVTDVTGVGIRIPRTHEKRRAIALLFYFKATRYPIASVSSAFFFA